MEKAKVYFAKSITGESLVKLYDKLEINLSGNVAVKLHSGEEGNKNYLKPQFVKDIINYVNGTVVECNTAYDGARDTTDKHQKLMNDHGWTKYFNVDILDSDGEDVLENKNGTIIQKNIVGSKMKNYDSMLVISHFKGHPMGGFGGALKNLSIGLASSNGKRYIHTGGKENASYDDMFTADHDSFIKAMADSAKTITEFYQGKIAYINAVVNLSVDCDCCANAEEPCMPDIGILASTDPLALDQACLDLVYNSTLKGKDKLIERIESRNGLLILENAKVQEIGSTEYELVSID